PADRAVAAVFLRGDFYQPGDCLSMAGAGAGARFPGRRWQYAPDVYQPAGGGCAVGAVVAAAGDRLGGERAGAVPRPGRDCDYTARPVAGLSGCTPACDPPSGYAYSPPA